MLQKKTNILTNPVGTTGMLLKDSEELRVIDRILKARCEIQSAICVQGSLSPLVRGQRAENDNHETVFLTWGYSLKRQ